MATKITDVYIYLGKRDKGAIRILYIGRGLPLMATRIDDVQTIGLPLEIASELKQIIYDNRIYWEPWIESADSFADFRAALKIRNYVNIPQSSQPEVYSTTSQSINVKSLPQKATMIRKGS